MSYTESVLMFGCEGEVLLGIVSEPSGGTVAPSAGVVIVVGGPQYRAGSHRQFVLLARALASKIAANPGAVLRMTKRLLREGERSSLESLLEISASYQALAHKTADHREAVTAFIQKRAPEFS